MRPALPGGARVPAAQFKESSKLLQDFQKLPPYVSRRVIAESHGTDKCRCCPMVIAAHYPTAGQVSQRRTSPWNRVQWDIGSSGQAKSSARSSSVSERGWKNTVCSSCALAWGSRSFGSERSSSWG